jgi:hypothetical protein
VAVSNDSLEQQLIDSRFVQLSESGARRAPESWER